jgi:flagellar protein FlgJ
MNDTSLTGLTSYHDFSGLAQLRSDAARDQAGAVRKTAEQFEAYFIQQMMKTMREAVERSDLVENKDADTFQDLMDKEVANKMAQRSALGLADMIERSMAQRGEATAAAALSAREKSWPLQVPAQALPLAGAERSALPLPRAAAGAYPLQQRGLPATPAQGGPRGQGGAE